MNMLIDKLNIALSYYN